MEEPTRVQRWAANAVAAVVVLWLRARCCWLELENWWLRRKLGVVKDRDQRKHVSTMSNGTRIYRVRLVGGPSDGGESVCSGDTVYCAGERYLRGADDRYYHTPEGAGRN